MYYLIYLLHFKDKKSNSKDATKKENSDNVNKKEEALSEQLELTKSDEDSLLKLMNECDFATTNAEMFIERLQTELVYLDTVRKASSNEY
jgi:hypothetical protein